VVPLRHFSVRYLYVGSVPNLEERASLAETGQNELFLVDLYITSSLYQLLGYVTSNKRMATNEIEYLFIFVYSTTLSVASTVLNDELEMWKEAVVA
jgi:hypothetical protein